MNRKRLALGGVVVAVLVAAGFAVFFYWRSLAIHLPWQPTPQGIYFEELLPPDVSFVASFHPTDDAERQRFEKIWGALLQDKKDVLLPFIVREFAGRKAAKFPLADILGLFGDHLEFTVAFTPGSGPPYRNIYLLFRANDPSKVRAVFERMKESSDQIVLDTPDAYVLDNNKFALGYSGLVGDIGFFAFASKENSQQLLARFEKRNSFLRPASFAATRDFRKTAKSFGGPMSGYIFFAQKDPSKILQTSAVRYRAEEDGFVFDGLTFSQGAAGDVLHQQIFQPFMPALAAKIPLSKALFYEEMGHVGSLILSQFASLSDDFKAGTGFNFETDILPFFDKDMVLALEDAGGTLPVLSLWTSADEPAAFEKAKAVLSKLDEKIKSWVALGGLVFAPPEGKKDKPVFELTKLAAPFSGSKVTIFPDRADSEKAPIPLLKLIHEPIEISYGITPDNIVFFSTRPNFEKTFSQDPKAETHPMFKLTQLADVKPGSVAFIDGQAVGAYIERVVNMARTSKKFSESDEQSYQLLKKYLAPVKGYVQSGQGNGENISMQGRLLIQP